MTVRFLIVDDEPIARERLARILKRHPDAEIVGEAGSADEAAALVAARDPDVLLLDIQMPGGDGFDLLDRLSPCPPIVVFVTAFDHHAIRAFDAAAVDYVTKPIDPIRLSAAIDRAIALADARACTERFDDMARTLISLREQLRTVAARDIWFWVQRLNDHIRIAARDVDYFESDGDYTRIVTGDRSHLYDDRLSTVEARLPEADFLRIHRGAIVRRAAVTAVRKAPFSGLIAVMSNGDELRVGRTHARAVRAILGTTRERRGDHRTGR